MRKYFDAVCRVLGRKVEDDIFNVILNSHHIEKVKKISETIILV